MWNKWAGAVPHPPQVFWSHLSLFAFTCLLSAVTWPHFLYIISCICGFLFQFVRTADIFNGSHLKQFATFDNCLTLHIVCSGSIIVCWVKLGVKLLSFILFSCNLLSILLCFLIFSPITSFGSLYLLSPWFLLCPDSSPAVEPAAKEAEVSRRFSLTSSLASSSTRRTKGTWLAVHRFPSSTYWSFSVF